MAAQPSTSMKQAGVSRIVILGIVTGAVAWLPLVWLDPIPEGVPVSRLPVVSLGKSSEIEPNKSPPQNSGNLFDNRFGALRSDWEMKSPDALRQLGSRPADAETDAAGEIGASTNDADQDAGTAERMQPATLPTADGDEGIDATPVEAAPLADARRKEAASASKRPSKSASKVKLHQPARVVAANFDEPLTTPQLETDGEASIVEWMHELNDADPDVAQRAAGKLTAQGFTTDQLRLARQLTSADSGQRAKLAAQLPGAAGIDARLWLTWLLRDEATEVRLAALSVLATSTDPETLRRVIEIARQDRDPRVRQQVDQLDKVRRAAR